MLGINVSSITPVFAAYDGERLEIEARFGHYDGHNFVSTVPWVRFDRLRRHLRNISTEKMEKSSIESSGNIRRITVIPSVPGGNEEVSWQHKESILDNPLDLINYGVRVAISREDPIDPITDFHPNTYRERMRYSYLISGDKARVDLTEVTNIDIRTHAKRTTYEVELEYIGDPSHIETFNVAMNEVFRWLYDTANIYTELERKNMVSMVNKLIGGNEPYGRPRDNIDRSAFVEARNLKSRDLVYGGLVGNQDGSYQVTYKTDGVRKIMVIDNVGVWLTFPPHEYNLVIRRNLRTLVGTILDGEVVPRERRKSGAPKADYLFYVFDCLVVQGQSCQMENHTKRMEYAQEIAKPFRQENTAFFVRTKDFFLLKTVDSFYSTMGRMFRELPTVEYETDGLIFTPDFPPYNPRTADKYPLSQRTLTKYPDVCKWKPQSQITIDFLIKWIPDGIQLFVYDMEKRESVPWKGTVLNPFTPGMVDKDHPLTRDIPTGSIVEYGWDDSREMLVPQRIRYDKPTSNRKDVAEDDWDDIHDPITEEVLQGTDFKLLFRYHNRIKNRLFSSLPRGATLLDIGTGRGGDIAKMRNLSRIVAVEPSNENISVLVERAERFDMSDRLFVVNGGGQDTEAISSAVNQFIGDKVDVISLMLSLSFFWQDSDTLDALVATITENLKPNGTIIFLTVDGDCVEELFEPVFGGPHSTEQKIGPAILKISPPSDPPYGRKLYVDIPGTIVDKQEEFLVHLSDLRLRLDAVGFQLTDIHRADKEAFLSNPETIFSSLYSFGTFVGTGVSKLNPPDEFIPLYPMVTPEEIAPVTEQRRSRQKTSSSESASPSRSRKSSKPVSEVTSENRSSDMEVIVQTDSKGRIIRGIPAINDDSYVPLEASWYNNLVRIATIGGSDSFIHAVLKAFYPPYQDNPDASYRVSLATKVRNDLGRLLPEENPAYPGHTYWETTNNGSFPDILIGQIENPALVQRFGGEYSLEGLRSIFRSKEPLHPEIFGYVSDVLGLDIYVLQSAGNDLVPFVTTHRQDIYRPAIVIVGKKSHYDEYDVVALDTANGFETIFFPGDAFLEIINSDYPTTNTSTRYDPDETLRRAISSWISLSKGGTIPPEVLARFPADDPFRMAIKRLFNI